MARGPAGALSVCVKLCENTAGSSARTALGCSVASGTSPDVTQSDLCGEKTLRDLPVRPKGVKFLHSSKCASHSLIVPVDELGVLV